MKMRNGTTGVLPCSCIINIINSGSNNNGFPMKTRKPGETGMLLLNGRAASLRRHHWNTVAVACLRMTSIGLDRLRCSSKTKDKPQPLLTRCRCPPRPELGRRGGVVLELRRALKRRRRGRRRRRPKLRRSQSPKLRQSRRPTLRRSRRPTMKRRCLPRQRSAASLRLHHRQAIAAGLRRHFVPLVLLVHFHSSR